MKCLATLNNKSIDLQQRMMMQSHYHHKLEKKQSRRKKSLTNSIDSIMVRPSSNQQHQEAKSSFNARKKIIPFASMKRNNRDDKTWSIRGSNRPL